MILLYRDLNAFIRPVENVVKQKQAQKYWTVQVFLLSGCFYRCLGIICDLMCVYWRAEESNFGIIKLIFAQMMLQERNIVS